jgi:hypothetical protein
MIEVRPRNNASTYGYLDTLPHIGDLITLDRTNHRVVAITHFPRKAYRVRPANGNEYAESMSVVWVGRGHRIPSLKGEGR